jgi:hypothetical protein
VFADDSFTNYFPTIFSLYCERFDPSILENKGEENYFLNKNSRVRGKEMIKLIVFTLAST